VYTKENVRLQETLLAEWQISAAEHPACYFELHSEDAVRQTEVCGFQKVISASLLLISKAKFNRNFLFQKLNDKTENIFQFLTHSCKITIPAYYTLVAYISVKFSIKCRK
jgi:hypothetical protein